MPETIGNTENDRIETTRRRDRAIVVVGTVAAAVVAWAVIAVLFGVDLQVVQGGVSQSVGLGSVITAAALAALLGWALLAGLERRRRRPKTIWTVVAVSVSVLSLAGPLSSATTIGATAALALLHLVVGAVAILGFRRTAR